MGCRGRHCSRCSSDGLNGNFHNLIYRISKATVESICGDIGRMADGHDDSEVRIMELVAYCNVVTDKSRLVCTVRRYSVCLHAEILFSVL